MIYRTKYRTDRETEIKFFRRVYRKQEIGKVCGNVSAALFGAALLAILVAEVFVESFVFHYDAFLVIGMAVCFVFAIFCGSLKKSAMNQLALDEARGGVTVDYTLDERGFSCVSRIGDSDFGAELFRPYSDFKWVKEYDDMWLCNDNGVEVHMILRGNASEGSDEELSAFFARTLGERFKVVKK